MNEKSGERKLSEAKMVTIKKGQSLKIPPEFTQKFLGEDWVLLLIRRSDDGISIGHRPILPPSSTIIHIFVEHFRQNDVGYIGSLHQLANFDHTMLWNFLRDTQHSQNNFRQIILQNKLNPFYVDSWGDGCHAHCKWCCHTFNGFYSSQDPDFPIENLRQDLLALGGLFNIRVTRYTEDSPKEFPYIPLETFYGEDSSCYY
jgi:hypothetical protein